VIDPKCARVSGCCRWDKLPRPAEGNTLGYLVRQCPTVASRKRTRLTYRSMRPPWSATSTQTSPKTAMASTHVMSGGVAKALPVTIRPPFAE
jgi:hypothetical protein